MKPKAKKESDMMKHDDMKKDKKMVKGMVKKDCMKGR